MKQLFLLFIAAQLLIACQVSSPKESVVNRNSYPDIFDLKGEITLPQQEGPSSFSDLGTWHSFSLGKDENPNQTGSFVGPYLMRQQESFWLSPSLIGLQIKNTSSNSIINLKMAKGVRNIFYPGMLQQTFEVEGLAVTLRLINNNERSTLVIAKVLNKGKSVNIQLGWKGNVFDAVESGFETSGNGLLVNVHKDENVQLLFSGSDIVTDKNTYSYWEEEVELGTQGKTIATAAFSYTFNDEELQKYAVQNRTGIVNARQALTDNETRWNAYINTLFQQSEGALLDVNTYDKLAVKSLLTLIHNWRSAAGAIYHQGIVPSYAASYFQGLWAWDSWKHAVAIAPFEGELAKDQIRAMYDYQNEEGMIADCFFRDLDIEGINWRNTKAPLSGWCIYEVYAQTQDVEFLKELYPKLIKYHEWWYINRDHDQNGLCEYGSTDGTRIAAAWESGMDNAVRFDHATILENREGAYSINQESVDLNAYLASEKRYIQKMAAILGDVKNEEKYAKEAAELSKLIQKVMYSAEDGFYYDVELTTQDKIQIQGPEGWAPLYNEVATDEQAKEIVKVIMDPERFNTAMPFPTLSAAHEQFNPEKGYWRGPVWLDQAYFGVVGMNYYGFENEAKEMAKKMVESAKGMAFTQEPIRENYHPLTREGLNAKHFSWSAAHILMLF